MTDIALHRRCITKLRRDHRVLNNQIVHFVANQPSDRYIAPELVEEIMEMRVPMPDKAKVLSAGTLHNEPTISREAYWTRLCESWARMGSR